MSEAVEGVPALTMLAGPVRRLAEMVAECPAFQRAVSAPGRAEALARVHHPHVRLEIPDGELELPMAVVAVGRFGFERGAGGVFLPKDCALELIFRDWDSGGRSDWAEIAFMNWVGAVCEELCEIHRRDPRLGLTAIALADSPKASSLAELGDGRAYWQAVFECSWSI